MKLRNLSGDGQTTIFSWSFSFLFSPVGVPLSYASTELRHGAA